MDKLDGERWEKVSEGDVPRMHTSYMAKCYERAECSRTRNRKAIIAASNT